MTNSGHPRDRHDEQYEALLAMIEDLAARIAALEDCCAAMQGQIGAAIDAADSVSASVSEITDQARLSQLRNI